MAASSADPPLRAASSASQRADESDLNPAAFLKSVRELSEKREREDAERYRKLEEEIEKGRQERAVRRAERARSISPEKTSTAAKSTLRSSTNGDSVTAPQPMTPPPSSSTAMDSSSLRSASNGDEIPEFKGFGSGSRSNASTPSTQSPAQASESSNSKSRPAQSASSLARSGTLSWQQRRPPSGGANSRPQSIVSSEKSVTGRSSTSTYEAEPSRDQIAASLGSRDPSWFKQTADRGVGNAAFRRSKDENVSGDDVVSGRRGLPGMSREASAEPASEGSPAPSESVRSETASLSRPGSARDSAVSSSKFSTIRSSTSSKPDLKSLIAADQGQEKLAPMSDRTPSVTDEDKSSLGRTLTMSSSQAPIANATERPASPTKGMGGFVQSAMMKRSDSAAKRWSGQPGSNISRQNSVASSRSGYGGLTGSHSMPRLEPTPGSREGSNEPASRPTSSSSNITNLTASQAKDDRDVFIKPALPYHSRSKSVASNYSTAADEGHTSPPSSPLKRWSPTKSSWLESAITKPESPRPSAARNSQPSWMTDIAKAKAQRASADNTPNPAEEDELRSSSPTKAGFGQSMLKRSESRDLGTPRIGTPKNVEDPPSTSASPMKAMFGQSNIERSEPRDLLADAGVTTSDAKSIPTPVNQKPIAPAPEGTDISPAGAEKETAKDAEVEEPKIDFNNQSKTDVPPEKSQATNISERLESPPPTTAKAKPETPPKPQTDFRSNLRSRLTSENKQKEAPEFLSKFANLRKTTTQNYVAPDVLKDNILRGKSDLAKTGGPVKTPRRDELKESLLARKEQWKTEKEQGVVRERKTSGPPSTPQKPEALAKRELLGRAESIKEKTSTEKPETATPEALARHKTLKEKPKPEASMPALEKQTSAPASTSLTPAPLQPKKQTSTPVTSAAVKQPTETSKLASRFNPGLAGILSRGPPATTTKGSDTPSRPESPALPAVSRSPPSEPPAEGAQLQDVRKGRAKGPKRRKGGARDAGSEAPVPPDAEPTHLSSPATMEQRMRNTEEYESSSTAAIQKPKPRAPAGSAASVMMASLQNSPAPKLPRQQTEMEKPSTPFKSPTMPTPKSFDEKPATPAKSPAVPSTKPMEDKPATPAKGLAISKMRSFEQKPASSPKSEALSSARLIGQRPMSPSKSLSVVSRASASETKPSSTLSASQMSDVPEFKGFRPAQKSTPSTQQVGEDMENVNKGSPSARSAASNWAKPSSPKKAERPAQIQLPSKKDEEAAMRSAGLLASSPSRPSSRDGLGIALAKNNGAVVTPPASAGLPPKPSKPSRAVSGQLQEATSNNGPSGSPEQSDSNVERQLVETFGSLPTSAAALSIDAYAAIANSPHQERVFKTVRKSVHVTSPDDSLKQLPQHEEYTFFDEGVYVCNHAYTIANGPKETEIFLWVGGSSLENSVEQANIAAKKLAKEAGNAFIHSVRQGFEPPGFLQALGGILVTRRGARETAPKQYMLCGRKQLGQIVFDEVDFSIDNLCCGFAYLISYPVTLQETKLYLWKGSACSPEEISAARLAAMDLSETGEIIEVDNGAEFSSFLKIFGAGTTKASIPKATALWNQKAWAPDKFVARLFRIQPAEVKSGLFTSMFRRPSWNNLSPARRQEEEVKLEAKEISPFMQSDLEADCIYLLDAYNELHVLLGLVFSSQPETLRNTLLAQTLLLASNYAMFTASTGDRPAVPKAFVLLSGVPRDLKMLFRHWDESNGLWGTGGLMAGSQAGRQKDLRIVGLDEVIEVVCKR